MASPITNGGVIIGSTERIRMARLNLKLVLTINKANPRPSIVEENAESMPMVSVFHTTPQP